MGHRTCLLCRVPAVPATLHPDAPVDVFVLQVAGLWVIIACVAGLGFFMVFVRMIASALG